MGDIVGYIHSMEGLIPVKTFQKWVYKIIVSNITGMKVRVTFWRDLAVDYSKKLQMCQIVEITGCTGGEVKFQFDPELKGVIAPMELHVQALSTVKILGHFDIATASPGQQLTWEPVSTADCLSFKDKPITVSGYLKTEFIVFKTTSGIPLAHGNLADGSYPLCIQIDGYKPVTPLEKGSFVIFNGKIEKSKPGSFFLRVDGMKNVVVDNNRPKLSLKQLKSAIYPPKKLGPEVEEVSSQKRYQEDEEKENSYDNEGGKKMKTD
ncbi:uncharacterized protein [Fopius arisanus]|uniref:Uncharacterized protein n=1 Tax=Fopius arisanus TaxID=64838 RepID=A0A9R1TNW1_9HYME|nr:PREDICTED: uncharacterized protein LOC105272534 [Fopius arisanus]